MKGMPLGGQCGVIAGGSPYWLFLWPIIPLADTFMRCHRDLHRWRKDYGWKLGGLQVSMKRVSVAVSALYTVMHWRLWQSPMLNDVIVNVFGRVNYIKTQPEKALIFTELHEKMGSIRQPFCFRVSPATGHLGWCCPLSRVFKIPNEICILLKGEGSDLGH